MKHRNSQFSIFSFDADVESRTLKGYAIRFNELSQINEDSIGKWATRITNGLTLEDKVDVYYEHNPQAILASTKNKSLKLITDSKGVYFEFTLGNTQLQKDVFELVKQGLINSMSFGVQITDSEWIKETYNNEEIDVRVVKSGKVFEISAVNNPAFVQTSLLVASNEDQARIDFIHERANSFTFDGSDVTDKEVKAKLYQFLLNQDAEKQALEEQKKKNEELAKLKEQEEEQIKMDLAKAKLKMWELMS